MFLLYFILILSVLVLISWINLILDKKRFNVPGPEPLPIIGNGLYFIGKPTTFLPALQNLFERFGDLVQLHLLHDRYLVINHPKYLEELMTSTELIVKGLSYKYLTPWLGEGLLTSKGARWHTHRKLLTPAFHFSILKNFLPIFLKNEKILINKLKKLSDGPPVDLFPEIALIALDNVAECVMGVSYDAQLNSESPYVRAINDLSTITAIRMRNPILGLDPIFDLSSQKKQQDSALKLLYAHTKKVIDDRQNQLTKQNITKLDQNTDTGIKNKYAFLDLLLLTETADGGKIDNEKIREEVETFMFEGHDTTTSGIVFCLYCIATNKDVQENILREQKTVLGDLQRDPSFSELKQMKYLELVIKESLRLYPSVPLMQRMVERDTEISGIFVPKNTTICVDIFHMQRNPKVHDNPLEFYPERFDKETSKNSFNWLAFSAGPRNCIGQKFAMMEMKVVIAAIVKNFQVLPSDIELQLCADIILRSNNGVHVKFVERT